MAEKDSFYVPAIKDFESLSNGYPIMFIYADEIGEIYKDKEVVQYQLIRAVEQGLMNGKTVILDGNNLDKQIRRFYLGFAQRYKRMA